MKLLASLRRASAAQKTPPMDDLLPHLLAFPPLPAPSTPLSDAEYDKQIQSLVQLLEQTPTINLTKGVSGGGDLLDILNPSINTLPYLHTILAHIRGKERGVLAYPALCKAFPPSGSLWAKMLEFMEHFDPIQIRYAGPELRCLIEYVAIVARAFKNPLIAVAPIRSAILRLDPSGSCLTSTHILFAKLCLEAHAFVDALPVLDKDIYHVPQDMDKASFNTPQRLLCSHGARFSFINSSSALSDQLTSQSYLLYFVYGAMLYMATKNWERGLRLLEIVIMSPGSATSKIQVEAYKKWVLVGLLLHGGPLTLPGTTSFQATRNYKALCKAYDNIADVFKLGNVDRLRAEFEAGQRIWQGDGNTGLLLQVLDAFRRFAIVKLGNTFAALTMADVALRTSPGPKDWVETENYVTSLINSGHLNATVTRSQDLAKPSILRFAASSTEGPQARSEQKQLDDLATQAERIQNLDYHVKEAGMRMALTKEYIDSARKSQKSKDSGSNGGDPNSLGPMTMGDEFAVDEDMMAGL
ncbi:hypothetical protein MMC12_002340 [Toensbergia leucococca]|nr:hypothetical protein [Toensbergia leucococca]